MLSPGNPVKFKDCANKICANPVLSAACLIVIVTDHHLETQFCALILARSPSAKLSKERNSGSMDLRRHFFQSAILGGFGPASSPLFAGVSPLHNKETDQDGYWYIFADDLLHTWADAPVTKPIINDNTPALEI